MGISSLTVALWGVSVAGPAPCKAGVLAVRVEVRCDFAVAAAKALRAIQTYTPAVGSYRPGLYEG